MKIPGLRKDSLSTKRNQTEDFPRPDNLGIGKQFQTQYYNCGVGNRVPNPLLEWETVFQNPILEWGIGWSVEFFFDRTE